MPTVFLDANIFFAAVRSHSGGSYFIIELAKKRQMNIVTVAYALAEAERNIKKKLGDEMLNAHYENLLSMKPTIQSLAHMPIGLEQKLSSCVPEKDIPIVLGALASGVEALVTLDQKHLLKNVKLLAMDLPFSMMTPGDFLKKHFL